MKRLTQREFEARLGEFDDNPTVELYLRDEHFHTISFYENDEGWVLIDDTDNTDGHHELDEVDVDEAYEYYLELVDMRTDQAIAEIKARA